MGPMAFSPVRGSAPAFLSLLMLSSISAYSADDGDQARGLPPSSARHKELVQMVRHDCGSCHGLTLAGGLGPALLPESLATKPVDYVERVILYGRPGTAMPSWQGIVSETEARWIAQQLLKGFPSER
jgi:cytochrome c55X